VYIEHSSLSINTNSSAICFPVTDIQILGTEFPPNFNRTSTLSCLVFWTPHLLGL
jgi:hypothetical protein